MFSWKNLSLKWKFGFGFGAVLVLLVAVAVWAVLGIQGIVGNAKEVIDGNKLKGEMAQREVDHLNWAAKVSSLLTDDSVTELAVEKNPHQCGFGQWYYGEGRKEAEAFVPEVAEALEAIEHYHNDLHESAQSIEKVFGQPHGDLALTLANLLADHIQWSERVAKALATVEPGEHPEFDIGVETDPAKCAFGVFLAQPETAELMDRFPALKSGLESCREPHNRLHHAAIGIEKAIREGNREEAVALYESEAMTALESVKNHLDQVISAENDLHKGYLEANAIYASRTQPDLKQVQSLLHEVTAKVNEHVMTDDQMLAAASKTRKAVMMLSLIAVPLGILLAAVIALGIIRPLRKGVNFAQTIADGDLTQHLDVDQKDEIGQLASALNLMRENLSAVVKEVQSSAEQVAASSEELSASAQNISSAATEQAASLEETSASIEELTASVSANSQHSNEANEISRKASTDASTGGSAVSETVESMRRIAEQISIIGDIADQTNLLALNAAIEAARAGEMGKGFAVVAVEVRKLAERSQEAAKEITELAQTSVGRAEEAGSLIASVVPSIQKVAEMVESINAACEEQTTGGEQITLAVQQLDQVTQQNTATSEEASAASEELAGQAQALQALVSRFRV